jgi:phenylpropionate dioxygenase-like ring-hydroxylating dioxygenase large terminal subunit
MALGRNLVLWRESGGAVHCLEDYCPHRGARLSRGEINADNISCRYHGVTLDGSGTIVRVPAMPGCALEGRKAVQSYAVIEANDGIFAYFPSSERPNPSALNLPEEFSDPAWSSILCMGRWQCSYRFVYDNFADPMHACYLHADSFTLAFGAKQDVMRVEPRADGFHIARLEQKDVNLDWTHVVVDGHSLSGGCRAGWPLPHHWLRNSRRR